jgi:hypothetical protein
MTASLHILTLDPSAEKPERCQVCWANQPGFFYEWRPFGGPGEAKAVHGFCCPECAIELVKGMRSEPHERATDDSTVNAESSDLVGPHDHKLSAFAATE